MFRILVTSSTMVTTSSIMEAGGGGWVARAASSRLLLSREFRARLELVCSPRGVGDTRSVSEVRPVRIEDRERSSGTE